MALGRSAQTLFDTCCVSFQPSWLRVIILFRERYVTVSKPKEVWEELVSLSIPNHEHGNDSYKKALAKLIDRIFTRGLRSFFFDQNDFMQKPSLNKF